MATRTALFKTLCKEAKSAIIPALTAELHHQGFLGWIFAHLMSLINFPMLVDRHMAKAAIGEITEPEASN